MDQVGTTAAQTPSASTRTMSTLNNSIEAINIAKELVPLELAQGVLSTVVRRGDPYACQGVLS